MGRRRDGEGGRWGGGGGGGEVRGRGGSLCTKKVHSVACAPALKPYYSNAGILCVSLHMTTWEAICCMQWG